jgi:alpha-methylacyl-CoA racemase
MAVGALEQRFYNEFIELLGIKDEVPARKDFVRWDELRDAVATRFRMKTREEWSAVFEGSDACVAPVLSLGEAPSHPHLAARGTFVDHGGLTQPAPAPRFSVTPGAVRRPPARPGADTAEVALDWDVRSVHQATHGTQRIHDGAHETHETHETQGDRGDQG